jgi:hypothetical protein
VAIDHFAALRSAPAAESTSFAETLAFPPFPASKTAGERGDPQKSAMFPALPLLPPEMTRGEAWRQRRAELEADWSLSEEWAAGLASLEQMPRPRGAGEARWKQIVEDGFGFVTRSSMIVAQRGWTVADAFGFDPDGASNDMGVIFLIRAGRTTILPDGVACIAPPDGLNRRWFTPGVLPASAPLIWDLDKKERSQAQKMAENRG